MQSVISNQSVGREVGSNGDIAAGGGMDQTKANINTPVANICVRTAAKHSADPVTSPSISKLSRWVTGAISVLAANKDSATSHLKRQIRTKHQL